MVTHATEQQNYRQSLSPEKKTQILCNDADAHKKQRKSLPPEKKIKNLQTDANAHKKKQESLSPEDKDLFDKNDAVALNKHRKSLAPNQKAQVLKKMLPNKKNIESLSLLNKKVKLSQSMQLSTKNNMNCFPQRKKARIMETKTEEHHEHLTEEEKKISAQIRSVAATLYEKVDLDKLTVEFLHEHFYKYPILALTYFYCCATDPCVAIFNAEL